MSSTGTLFQGKRPYLKLTLCWFPSCSAAGAMSDEALAAVPRPLMLRAVDVVWPSHESKESLVKGLLARLFVEDEFPHENLVYQADMVKLGEASGYVLGVAGNCPRSRVP